MEEPSFQKQYREASTVILHKLHERGGVCLSRRIPFRPTCRGSKRCRLSISPPSSSPNELEETRRLHRNSFARAITGGRVFNSRNSPRIILPAHPYASLEFAFRLIFPFPSRNLGLSYRFFRGRAKARSKRGGRELE